MLVHDAADFTDLVLEHTMRGRVRDHQARESVPVIRGFLPQVGDVDVPVRRCGDDDDAHSGHRGARRVRPVCRSRDEHHVAVRIAAVAMIRPDGHEPRELPLCTRVRLQRHGGEPRYLAQRRLELPEDLSVALGLIGRRERMHPAEVLPRHGPHLGCRVQLHRAGAEWNHRGVEPDVLSLQAANVPHHLRLGPVRVEHRVRQELARAPQRRRVASCRGSAPRRGGDIDARLGLSDRARKHVDDVAEVVRVHGLVQRDADCRLIDDPEVDARRTCVPFQLVHPVRNDDAQRVEVMGVGLLEAEVSQLTIEQPRSTRVRGRQWP